MYIASTVHQILSRMPSGNRTAAEKCHDYAKFAENLSHNTAHGLFWGMFAITVVVIFITSQLWLSMHKSAQNLLKEEDEVEQMLRGEPTEAVEAHKENLERIYRKKVARCFYVSLGCSVIGLLAGVFAAFFTLNLGFCQEEDLMPFYWATYTVLVAGSIIAIFGLNIGLYYMKSPENRPWNASLGTPVIALVSILDVIFHAIKGAILPKKKEKEKGQEALLPMSRSISTKTVGSLRRTVSGGYPLRGVLVVFHEAPTSLPEGCQVLGPAVVYVQSQPLPGTVFAPSASSSDENQRLSVPFPAVVLASSESPPDENQSTDPAH
ncbi:hypothetical protein BGZ60DRAFT_433138 [Tricladium varicosporioides]|nr:hypothetical protein BGZ60DRAFT_433138 [Hymenoscyphus varicosporioides]